MTSAKKGFRANKTPTKQDILNTQGDQLAKMAGQLQSVTQMVIQSSRHLQQVQQEVGLLATLLRYSEAGDASKEGDFVVIDCIGQAKKEDGSLDAPFAGGTLYTHAVELDADGAKYVPGFVQGLVGKKATDRFDLTVTFPEDYHMKDLAGKEVVFDTTVLKVLRPSPVGTAIVEKEKSLKEAAVVSEESASN